MGRVMERLGVEERKLKEKEIHPLHKFLAGPCLFRVNLNFKFPAIQTEYFSSHWLLWESDLDPPGYVNEK